MSKSDKNNASRAGGDSGSKSNDKSNGEAKVKVSGWSESDKAPRWKDFPVPDAVGHFRVTFTRQAYADLVAHAKEDLSSEVCGVLAGQFCEDGRGLYVSVEKAVRGTSTRKGASHVTYTQETWNKIHKEMEEKHSSLSIVGWYHSHPGFGVEFSDMDLFIQQNFFATRGQIAFVTDPLGGEEALCVQGAEGVDHLERFWVDGRARQCRSSAQPAGADSAPGDSRHLVKAVESVESRLRQTMQALEDLRTSYHRFLGFVGMLVAVGVLFWMGTYIYDNYIHAASRPQIGNLPDKPVSVKTADGQWVWVKPIIVTEPVAPQMQAQLKDAERQIYEAEKAAQDAKNGQPPSGSPATQNSPSSATKEAGKP